MKHLKLFEEFNSTNYRLDLAVPGKQLARGSMGEPVKDIEELEYDDMYWFPVPSGAGYDVPTLGCLGVTGSEGEDDEPKYDEGNEFTSWSDATGYNEVANFLAQKTGETVHYEDEVYQGLEGLGSGDDWITYDEMKAMIATGKVLKFVDDPKYHGLRTGTQYGI